MSIEENKEIDMIDQSYENNKYFIMILNQMKIKKKLKKQLKN